MYSVTQRGAEADQTSCAVSLSEKIRFTEYILEKPALKINIMHAEKDNLE